LIAINAVPAERAQIGRRTVRKTPRAGGAFAVSALRERPAARRVVLRKKARSQAMPDADDSDFDAQDQAEVLDETNLTEDGEDIANFDTIADVFDSTEEPEDAEEDEEVDADDLDPDDLDALEVDEDELEETNSAYEPEVGKGEQTSGKPLEDEGDPDDVEGLGEVRDAGSVEGGEDDVTDFQSSRLDDKDLAELGYSEATGGAKRS
jgi:hypothetical protein